MMCNCQFKVLIYVNLTMSICVTYVTLTCVRLTCQSMLHTCVLIKSICIMLVVFLNYVNPLLLLSDIGCHLHFLMAT